LGRGGGEIADVRITAYSILSINFDLVGVKLLFFHILHTVRMYIHLFSDACVSFRTPLIKQYGQRFYDPAFTFTRHVSKVL